MYLYLKFQINVIHNLDFFKSKYLSDYICLTWIPCDMGICFNPSRTKVRIHYCNLSVHSDLNMILEKVIEVKTQTSIVWRSIQEKSNVKRPIRNNSAAR